MDDLPSIKILNLSESELPIYTIIQTSLLSSTDSSARLADTISCHCNVAEDPDLKLWSLWAVLVETVRQIPPEHPWQDKLAETVTILGQRGDTVGEASPELQWEDLPRLGECLKDNWFDPTVDEGGPGPSLEDFQKWKSLNSFTARLTTADFVPWLNFPIWCLRTALEEPPIKGGAMGCRLWVAREWIIRCGHVVFAEISEAEKLGEAPSKSFHPGSLAEGISPLSIARWGFWKKRFLEIGATSDALELEDDTMSWTKQVVQRMEDLQQGRILEPMGRLRATSTLFIAAAIASVVLFWAI